MNDPDTCQHIDYDDYFEKCNDCGMQLEDITKEKVK